MAKLLRKLFPKSKKRIKPGLQDGARWRIYEAGWRALNEADHEDVSVAHVAKAAGVSIGAFYRRYPDKNAFLDSVVFNRLQSARERTEKALEPIRWRRASNTKIVTGIVEHLVVTLHGDMRGAVRTAFRRRRPGQEKLCPLIRYQAFVADACVLLVLERLGGGRRREEDIRAATQIVLATIMGGLLNDPGPLKLQRQRTVDALSQVMASHVGLSPSRKADDDAPYSDALILLPPEKAEEAKPADLKRALKAEDKAKAKSPAPPKPKASTKTAPGKGKTIRVQFI
jgi:AcrR family transcriptional regulator